MCTGHNFCELSNLDTRNQITISQNVFSNLSWKNICPPYIHIYKETFHLGDFCTAIASWEGNLNELTNTPKFISSKSIEKVVSWTLQLDPFNNNIQCFIRKVRAWDVPHSFNFDSIMFSPAAVSPMITATSGGCVRKLTETWFEWLFCKSSIMRQIMGQRFQISKLCIFPRLALFITASPQISLGFTLRNFSVNRLTSKFHDVTHNANSPFLLNMKQERDDDFASKHRIAWNGALCCVFGKKDFLVFYSGQVLRRI